MPKFLNNSLEIQIGEKRARELLNNRFKEKGWKRPIVRELVLLFFPRYRFEYHIACEEGEGKERCVSDFSLGKGVFDPRQKKLVEEEFTKNFSKKTPEGTEFKVVHPDVRGNQAKKIVSLLLSKKEKTPKESIDFLHFTLFFVPVWSFTVECEEKRFEMEINAFSGKITEKTPIPVKTKPWSEAVEQSLTDLKKPKNWWVYFKEMVSVFSMVIKRLFFNKFVRGFFRLLWKNKTLQLIILLIVLFYLLYIAIY